MSSTSQHLILSIMKKHDIFWSRSILVSEITYSNLSISFDLSLAEMSFVYSGHLFAFTPLFSDLGRQHYICSARALDASYRHAFIPIRRPIVIGAAHHGHHSLRSDTLGLYSYMRPLPRPMAKERSDAFTESTRTNYFLSVLACLPVASEA
jgi:hypothetical protein